MGNKSHSIELPFDLPEPPSDWVYEPLGNLVDQSRGISYGVVQPGTETATGIPIVRVVDIRNNRINTTMPLRVSQEIESKHIRTRLKGREVLVTLVGTVGESAIVGPDLVNWNVARAVGVLPVSNEMEPEWIHFCIRSPLLQHYIRTWCTTTVQATFNLRDVARLPIPVPPLKVRKNIIGILGTLDDKIELNRRMNETLEAMAKALFKSWFVDFDPVREKAAGRQPTGLDAATAKLFPDSFEDSPLGKIPKGWRVGSLGDCLDVLETGNRPKGGVGGILEGVPSIGAESIKSIGTFDFAKLKYIPEQFYVKLNRGKLASRDVLLYKDGGRPGEFEPHVSMFGDGFPFDRMAINEHVYRLRAKPFLSQSYLYYWLSSEISMEAMRRRGTGVAIPGLNSTAVRSLETLVPTLDLSKRFEQSVEPLITKLFSLCKESRTLATTRDALLPKLLSGEVRV